MHAEQVQAFCGVGIDSPQVFDARCADALWLGEFGENDREWLQKVARLCEENDIGWALWAWKRVELDRDKPAIQTIDAPASWDRLADYLIGAPTD